MNETEIKNALNQIGNDLRQAERQMFNGKAAEAMEIVVKTGELIGQVKNADPQNAMIKGHESKFLKLKGDLEKRLNKPAASAPSSAAAVPAGGVPKQADLPWDARKPMQDMKDSLRVVERNLQQLEAAPADEKASWMKRIDEYLQAAKNSLESAKNEAGRKGVSTHPDFDEALSKIAEAENRYASARSSAVSSINAASEKSGRTDADIAELKAERGRLIEFFNQAAVPYYNDLEPMRKMLNSLEAFEKNEGASLKKRLDEFSSKYGTTKEEIDAKAASEGYSGNDRPSWAWEELTEGLKKIAAARKLAAEDLIKKMTERIGKLEGVHDFARENIYTELKEWHELAGRFEAANEQVKTAKEMLEKAIDADKKKLEAKIDSVSWPGNSKGGEADAAITFFKNDKDWGARPKGIGPEDQPRIPLGVSIHGSWSVQATDILGKPIQYGLPAFVAVQIEREQPLKRVRVYDVTLRTKEGPNAEPKPPFESITVGNSYYIRPDKIK